MAQAQVRLLQATSPVVETVPEVANALEPLSEREREIARLVSTGLSNKEIGLWLGISHWTVSTHLRRVFAKLEISRRIELCQFVDAAISHRKASRPGGLI